MNSSWSCSKTNLDGVMLITPFCANDNRGFFLKDYSEEIFASLKLDYHIKEVFYSFSSAGVIRGMHFQREEQMGKLVRCISGKIYDVVCDLRKNSPSLGNWQAFELSSDNMHELLIPEGFAHGFLALEDSMVSYKCSSCFVPQYDDGIVWNDCDLNILWPLNNKDPVISQKDKNLQSFKIFTETYGGL